MKLRCLVPALCLLTVACSHKEEEEKEADAIAPVQAVPAAVQTIHQVVEADGVLFPMHQSSVTSKISAPVESFAVNRGDHVSQGQIVAILEHRDLSAAVAESKGALEQAEANLRSTTSATVPEEVVKARTEAESTRQQFEAAQKLLESRQKLFQEGALPRKQVDEAQVAFAQAKGQSEAAQEHLRTLQSVGRQEQVAAARAQVDSARAHLQASEAQLSYAMVRSPIGGVVADRPLWPGEMATAGAPLLVVMESSHVVARANVTQSQALLVKPGSAATIKVVDGNYEVPGKLTVVSPATDPASTTVQLWVQSDNPGERLKPGASVRVSIVAATIPNATVVPASAILAAEGGGSEVMVVTPANTAQRKKVELGVREGDKVQILSGVSPGEQVITVGGVGLEDKAKVRIVRAAESEK